jgi:hypothetical protein
MYWKVESLERIDTMQLPSGGSRARRAVLVEPVDEGKSVRIRRGRAAVMDENSRASPLS